MADRSQVAAILADPDASAQEKYEALVANGWSKDAAARATGYTVPTAGAATTTVADTAKKAEDAAVAAGRAAQAATAAAKTAVPAAQAATAASGVDAFKKFIVENNPGVKIDELPNDMAALQKSYPKGWAAYSKTAAPAPAPAMAAPAADSAAAVLGATPKAPSADYAAKQARFVELITKAKSSPLTAAEQTELKALMASASEMQTGYMPLKSPEQAKTEFDAAKAAYAAKTGVPVADVGVNPDLLDTIRDLNAEPATATPAASAAPSAPTAVDAGAQAVIAQVNPDATPAEAAKKAEALAETAKADPNFADTVKKLSSNLGITILEAIQAGMLGYIGGYTGNWQKTAQQLRLEKEEREKTAADELAERRAERAASEKQWMTTLAAQQEESAKQRALQRELAQAKYTAALQAGMTPDQAAIAALSD